MSCGTGNWNHWNVEITVFLCCSKRDLTEKKYLHLSNRFQTELAGVSLNLRFVRHFRFTFLGEYGKTEGLVPVVGIRAGVRLIVL